MKYSKDGYKRTSKDKNNPYNIIPSGNITMKDVDFPVFGMDNLGNSRVMMPGANYTFPGSSVFEVPLVQRGGGFYGELFDALEPQDPNRVFQNSDAKDFTLNYINSPKYLERLQSSGYNFPEDERDLRASQVADTGYMVQRGTPGFIDQLIKMYKGEPYSAYGSMYSPSDDLIIYNSDDAEKYGYGDGSSIIAHEYGHAELQNFKPNRKTGDRLNQYDIDELVSRLQTYEGQTRHDTEPDENKSDLNALRFELFQQGLYDAGTEDIDKETLRKSKSSYLKNRLLKNYSEDDLIWLLNNIAMDDSQQSELFMAQAGGDFDPEMMFRDKYNTDLTEDELTQFTEWVKSESARQGRDIMMDMGAYDIQGFWKSGDFEKMDEDNHGSDKWKKPNHPTFSNQSVYHNVDGFQGGTWQDDGGYIPSEHTKKLYDAEYYNWLFGREPHRPEYLVLPKNQKGGSLPMAQLGIEPYVAPSDNTRVAMPPIIDTNIQLQEEEGVPLPPDQGEIRPYEEPSIIEKGMSYLANPMTTLGYLVRGQDLPDRIPMDVPNRNPYDYAFDVLNPFAFLGYGDAAVDDLKQGEYVDAAFNALGAVPFIPAGVQAGKPIVQTGKTAGKNIIKDVDLAIKRSKIKSGVPNTDQGTFKYVENYINDPAYQKYVNTEQVRLARDFNQGNLRIGLNQNRPAGFMFTKGNPLESGYVPTIHDKINYRQSYDDILKITRPVRDDGIQVLGRYPDIKFPSIDDIAANAPGNKFSNTYLQLGKDMFADYPRTLKGRFDATKNYLDKSLNTGGIYFHPAAGRNFGNKFYTNRVGSFGNTQGTNIHEWSHFMDAGSGRLSRQQRSDLKGLVNTDLLKSSSKSGKSGRYDFGYYTQPTEIKARMMEERLRLGLKPSDPYTLKHFETAGDLSGMRKYLNLKDPQNFINIMNKYYQEGGDLPKAQTGFGLTFLYNRAKDAFVNSDVNKYLSNKLEEATGYDDIGKLASTYANPYNYTRGAGYEDAASAVGGFLSGEFDAISAPKDYTSKASNKDDAFGKARKDLGPGQSFVYDGTRYTTDYYGQTEDANTNRVLGLLEQGIDYQYDQGTYDRFIDVWNQLGQPNLNIGADYEPGFLGGFSPSFQEVTDVAAGLTGQESRVAPHVNPMTDASSGGNIFITEDYMEGGPYALMDILLEELSHSQQLREMGRLPFSVNYVKDLISHAGDQGATYKTEGALEHDAHSVRAIPLKEYVFQESWTNKKRGGSLRSAQEGEETVSFDDLERGIRHTESLNGVLMLNPESSATGLYGQLWSEVKDQYDGTRAEFAEDTDFQKDLFRKRAYGELEGIPGLLLAGEEVYNEYKDVDHGMSMLDIAALSNFLGRQGAREYIGYHIRDGKSLETVFPKLYGENAEYSNKTPDEYIETFRKGVLEDKKSGGEFMRKMNRLKQQLDLYNRGGVISPIAKKELEERGLIEPVIMRVGGSYTIKSGDTLGRIARDNGLTLKELVDLNPTFRGREGMIRPGEQVFFDVNSKDIAESNNPVLKHRVKRGESLSAIANRYKVSVAEIAELNNITNPYLILVNQKLIIPQHSQYEETESTKSQEAAAVSPITTIDEVVVNDTTPVNEVWVKREQDENGVWRSVSGKKNNIQEINKLDQFQTIVQGMNDEYGVDEEKVEKVYTVKAGDNLTKIAEKEGVSLGRLMADNGISRQNQNNLRVGQKLTINRTASNAYLILDEKKGKIHLLYPGEETPRQSYDVLTGQATGDAATVTKVAVYYKGKQLSQDELNEAMKDNGVSTIDELIKVPGYRTKVDWKSGNKQTGAGVYTISSAKADGGRAYGADTRADVPSFTFENEDGISQSMAFHGVTRGRVSNLYDNDGTNNRLTNGCINGKCTDLQELYDNPDVGVGTMMYVLPEDKDNAFVYENGKLNLYASKENIEKAETSYDQLNSKGEVIGEIEGGQGINTSINNLYNYKPIMFEYNNDIAEESGYIDGTAGNRLEEYNEITKPFLNALATNKKDMMEILNIDGDLYNDIALTAFGIYGYESGMGDRNNWVSDYSRLIRKAVTGKGSSGSVERKYDNISGKGKEPYRSVGWTQLRVADGNTDPRERELLAEADKRFETNFTTPIETKLSQAEIDLLSPDEYKIAEANDFKGRVFSYNDGENTISQYHQFDINNSELMDPEKSAIATALILGNRYQTQISREDKNSEDFDVYTSLAKTWRPGKKADNYARFVNNHIPIVTLSETNIDNMDEKVVTKEEPKSNWEIFQDNTEEAWDTFTNMMARSAKTMLRPIMFSYGGEFGLQNQIQFYNDYVRGVYDNTQQSKSAKKLYDKINRMYYNDYKGTKMNALDVMNRMNTPPNN